MLAALAEQLAVAVQNAQLHERATELSRQREAALASERDAARRLRALYEISRSFAQELSLEQDARGARDDGRRRARRRCSVDRDAGRSARAPHAALDPRQGSAARRCGPRDPLPSGAVRCGSGAAAVPRREAVPAAAQSRRARAVPREGLDRGGRSRRDAGGDDRGADDLLVPARAARSARTRSRRALAIAGTGGARGRQRPPLPAAEGVRRHDAALASAARAAGRARGSTSARSTSRRRASTSAATSTTSSSSTTVGSRSSSAT